MVDFKNFGLPIYRVIILYKNGDSCVFVTPDYLRASKRFHRYSSFGFISKNKGVCRVIFENGKTGYNRYINFY